jgi:hypothetical protein
MKNFFFGVAMTIIVTLAGWGLFYYLTTPTLSMGYLSLPNFNSTSNSIMTEYNDFTEQVATALPTLKEMGFEDPTFCIQLGLLPKAKLRLRSSNISDWNKVDATAPTKPNWIFTNAIVAAAKNAKKIQNLAKLDGSKNLAKFEHF